MECKGKEVVVVNVVRLRRNATVEEGRIGTKLRLEEGPHATTAC
jgi:hypothetical protein